MACFGIFGSLWFDLFHHGALVGRSWQVSFGFSHALFVCFVGLWRCHNGRCVLIVGVPPTRMGAVKALLPLMRDLAVAGVGGVVSWSCANDNKDNQHHTVSYHQPNQLFQLLFLEGKQISLPLARYE